MEPIVLIHGYSAESKKIDKDSIVGIYGTLPQFLSEKYGQGGVVEIDLSRYVSLNDGVTVDDISHALNRALCADYSYLLQKPFHVIIHSTGALAIRNWIRRYSPKPSPIKNLIHLAGANFGSGWAHIGKGQIAQWGRLIFDQGAERGVQVLNALELGSSWTIDLHSFFLREGTRMLEDYKIFEYVVIGTQADAAWYTFPIRYAKEDGSDGVVRVSGGNLNFNYVRFGPKSGSVSLDWNEVKKQLAKYPKDTAKLEQYYEIKERSQPGQDNREEIPIAIPFQCAHTGKNMGIVSGKDNRDQVLKIIQMALETRTLPQWRARVNDFSAETKLTYEWAKTKLSPGLFSEPRQQYDHHAQLIFRLVDQDRNPVKHFDIFFEPLLGKKSANEDKQAIQSLFEDKHLNGVSPNVILFYLRTNTFKKEKNDWISTIDSLDGCFLNVVGTEPQTGEIIYLPMHFEFNRDQLMAWVQGHRTTIIDVELFRLPSPNIYRLVKYS